MFVRFVVVVVNIFHKVFTEWWFFSSFDFFLTPLGYDVILEMQREKTNLNLLRFLDLQQAKKKKVQQTWFISYLFSFHFFAMLNLLYLWLLVNNEHNPKSKKQTKELLTRATLYTSYSGWISINFNSWDHSLCHLMSY